MPENDLRADYDAVRLIAEKMRIAVRDQLEALVQDNNITLGTPLESRVKSWESLDEKRQRRSLALTSVSAMHDLVGLRLTLLFVRDVDVVCQLISDTFTVESFSDVGTRLDETQFGYKSHHFVIKLPQSWLSMPTLKGVDALRAEIQVRTVAQHIWAAASHKLQYKHEQSVPPPVRRAIHRVAALLETVDLEFERVLQARDSYQATIISATDDEILNVDNVSATFDDMLPSSNKYGDIESYDEALQDLARCGLKTVSQLKSLISRRLKAVLDYDAKQVAGYIKNPSDPEIYQRRAARGVLYSHVGLVRLMLRAEYGKDAVPR